MSHDDLAAHAAPGAEAASGDTPAAGAQVTGSLSPGAGEGFDAGLLPGGLRAALEAILMVADEPVTPAALAGALGASEAAVTAVLTRLAEEFDSQGRGFELRAINGGWRMYSRHALAPAVERFLTDGAQARLTKAALETLAVIAYRQPVTRARIGAIRGVNVDGVVRTLLTRGLITEAGLDSDHGAILYGTTEFFLQRLGIGSLDELPALAPYLPDLSEVTDDPGGAAPVPAAGPASSSGSAAAGDAEQENHR